MVNGVILNKLQVLEQTLAELRSLGELRPETLREDWRTWRAVERDLQILVEVVVDVCQRALSLSGQTPATSGADAVARCIALGMLSDKDVYRQMVQFRNFVVHRYDRVDAAVLVDIVNHRLGDFEQFRAEVLAYVRQDAA